MNRLNSQLGAQVQAAQAAAVRAQFVQERPTTQPETIGRVAALDVLIQRPTQEQPEPISVPG
jgi:hypothetical protein